MTNQLVIHIIYFNNLASTSIAEVEKNLENIFTALVKHVHNKDHHHMLLAAIVRFKQCPNFDFYDEDNEIVDMLREKTAYGVGPGIRGTTPDISYLLNGNRTTN